MIMCLGLENASVFPCIALWLLIGPGNGNSAVLYAVPAIVVALFLLFRKSN
jgi:hypothetical protein